MTDSHKERLVQCYTTLVDNMIVDGVLVHLISAHILTFREVEEITYHGVRAIQVQALLNTLIRKPDHAFDKFIEALQSTQQGHLANLLIREGKSFVLCIWRYLVCCTYG